MKTIVIRLSGEEDWLKQRAKELDWKETILQETTPAVIDEETGDIITPAVIEEVPNPVTWEQSISASITEIVARETLRAQAQQAKKLADETVEAQIKAGNEAFKQAVSVEVIEAQ